MWLLYLSTAQADPGLVDYTNMGEAGGSSGDPMVGVVLFFAIVLLGAGAVAWTVAGVLWTIASVAWTLFNAGAGQVVAHATQKSKWQAAGDGLLFWVQLTMPTKGSKEFETKLERIKALPNEGWLKAAAMLLFGIVEAVAGLVDHYKVLGAIIAAFVVQFGACAGSDLQENSADPPAATR